MTDDQFNPFAGVALGILTVLVALFRIAMRRDRGGDQ